MTHIRTLHQAQLDTAELGEIAAWCLEQLAEELGESAFPHDAVPVLRAFAPSLDALSGALSDGAANFGSSSTPTAQAVAAALGEAAGACADLHRAHQRACYRMEEDISSFDERRRAAVSNLGNPPPSPQQLDRTPPGTASGPPRNPARSPLR